MKQGWLIGFILVALIGLAGIQMRLLWIGMNLEMRQFERAVEVAMSKFQGELLAKDVLEAQLSQAINTQKTSPSDITHRAVLDTLRQQMQKRLEDQDIHTDFSIAITDKSALWTLLHDDVVPANTFRFNTFRIYLGSTIQQLTGMECYLHLHIAHLFYYLLRQLYYLIVPSLLFLFMLLSCLILLLRQTSNLRHLNQIKNDFINNLTHELKTPVFSIGLSSKLIQKQPERALELLPIIEQENNKMRQHVDKVLELASLEQKKHHFQMVQKDAHQVIQQVVNTFFPTLELNKAELHLQLEAPQTLVLLDESHFANALFNILDNALKYNDRTPEITISTFNLSKNIVIHIQDNGIGISAEHQKYVFEKFYRIPKGNTHAVKGFGLGLSYAKQVVKAHRGTITLQSELGVGSTFIIKIPLA